MLTIELEQLSDCPELINWAMARYVVYPHKWRRPIVHDDGSLTFLGDPVILPSYTSFLGEYEWWLTQEIKKGEPTRARVIHKRATPKVFSHSCTTVANAVYMCMIEHKRRGGLIELPERYAERWLGWAI